jgi:hypothetical protein
VWIFGTAVKAVVAGVFALSHTVDDRDEWRHE